MASRFFTTGATWDYIKIKSFFKANRNNQHNEKVTYGMGKKIFASHIYDKELISKTHMKLIQLNSKKNPIIKLKTEKLEKKKKTELRT